jgi:hypothetical protein
MNEQANEGALIFSMNLRGGYSVQQPNLDDLEAAR